MILVDFSGSMFAAVSVDLAQNKAVTTDINYLRHIIFNQIKSYNKKFSKQYGELIICLDSNTGNWRKQIFPYYKAKRIKVRAESGIDWGSIFKDVEQIVTELKTYFPYRVIRIPQLEADDVIALLTMNADKFTEKNIFDDMKYPVLIVSNDKDFRQLHKYNYVKQFFPRIHTVIKEQDPEFFLTEQIIRGDNIDGIPNIRSDEDTFVTYGKRQNAVRAAFIREFCANGFDTFSDFEKERYKMNKTLIDLSKIPSEYIPLIDTEMSGKINKNKFKLMQFLINNKLSTMIEHIDDFYQEKNNG